jgi:PTS system glucitol/sorbitol-specific IIA component
MLQFEATITHIGAMAKEALEDDMLILFNETAPEDVADYCFVHDHRVTNGNITTESTLLIAEKDYIVTAVGEAANQNLVALGHITIKFDGRSEPEFPGTIHVIGHCPSTIKLGDRIVFG